MFKHKLHELADRVEKILSTRDFLAHHQNMEAFLDLIDDIKAEISCVKAEAASFFSKTPNSRYELLVLVNLETTEKWVDDAYSWFVRAKEERFNIAMICLRIAIDENAKHLSLIGL